MTRAPTDAVPDARDAEIATLTARAEAAERAFQEAKSRHEYNAEMATHYLNRAERGEMQRDSLQARYEAQAVAILDVIRERDEAREQRDAERAAPQPSPAPDDAEEVAIQTVSRAMDMPAAGVIGSPLVRDVSAALRRAREQGRAEENAEWERSLNGPVSR